LIDYCTRATKTPEEPKNSLWSLLIAAAAGRLNAVSREFVLTLGCNHNQLTAKDRGLQVGSSAASSAAGKKRMTGQSKLGFSVVANDRS